MINYQRDKLSITEGRPVPIALEKSPKTAQHMEKRTQIVPEFCKKCLKFRQGARKLLTVACFLFYFRPCSCLYILLVLSNIQLNTKSRTNQNRLFPRSHSSYLSMTTVSQSGDKVATKWNYSLFMIRIKCFSKSEKMLKFCLKVNQVLKSQECSKLVFQIRKSAQLNWDRRNRGLICSESL